MKSITTIECKKGNLLMISTQIGNNGEICSKTKKHLPATFQTIVTYQECRISTTDESGVTSAIDLSAMFSSYLMSCIMLKDMAVNFVKFVGALQLLFDLLGVSVLFK